MSCFTCSVSRVCFLLVATLLLFTEVHCFKNRKLSQGGSIFAGTDVFSSSGFPGFGNFGAAQGAGRATVDEGTATAGAQTATQASGGDDLLDAICTKPSDPTTAEALGQALAAGKNSAEAVAASKAIAAAGEKCCDSLKTAIARAASAAEASGKGDAFVSAASRSEAAATNACGKEALAQAASASRASNGNSQAESTATGSASGPNAQSTTQTQSQVGPGSSSSSSMSFATSG